MTMICGIDEAGRGPLAGPVCAAAVVLPDDFPVEVLADSKKLKQRQREDARCIIVDRAVSWGIGWASHDEIDAINILRASLLAMRRAFMYLAVPATGSGGTPWSQKLETEAPFGKPFSPGVFGAGPFPENLTAIADGLYTPDLPIPCAALVKADDKVHEVMAASILAKTARDQLMVHYGTLYPQYGYEVHKGYPTARHRELVLAYGPSPIQRKTFQKKKEKR